VRTIDVTRIPWTSVTAASPNTPRRWTIKPRPRRRTPLGTDTSIDPRSSSRMPHSAAALS
jgi:hypothetical protein